MAYQTAKRISRKGGPGARVFGSRTLGRKGMEARHTFRERLRQRVFGLALGSADCNDAARLKGDPIARCSWVRSPRRN